jgi:hypothetical protein
MPHKYANDFHMDGDIVRWDSNNSIPFDDVLQEFYHQDMITVFQFVRSNTQRVIEVDQMLVDYRKQMENHVPDEEELYEMRAAFGEGASVVNVVTGKVTIL